jgi:hypothetical protein
MRKIQKHKLTYNSYLVQTNPRLIISIWHIVILFAKFTANKTTKSYINSPAKKYATTSYILDIATLDLFGKKNPLPSYPKSQETKSSYPNLSHWIRNSKLVEETQRRKTKIAEELVT